jgi:crotonobetainyl-CoA:carnitine CoA-transferase CaiB-like acyl-CoA transferase
MGALSDIRIIDFTRVLAGPYCTQLLGDLGANIIKIEKPVSGDDTRQWGPPFLLDDDDKPTKESAYYLSCNRNKKSLSLDFSKKEGQEIIYKLLEHSDILIENFSKGTLQKYNLDYETLKHNYPHLIYCSITGFGQTGPLSDLPGYDLIIQAFAGMMSSTGEPSQEPTKVGVAISDILTGLNASSSILAALHYRNISGQGQLIDISLNDCTLAAMVNIAQYYLTSGELAPRLGNAHPTIAPYQMFKTADGFITLAIGNDKQFNVFSKLINKEHWVNSDNFGTNQARIHNREALINEIIPIILTNSSSFWIDLFISNDIPVSAINSIKEAFTHEQTTSRNMTIKMNHELTSKTIDLVGSPLKLSKTPPEYKLPPPYCGQDNNDILKTLLNFSDDEVEKLKQQRVI